MKRNVFEIMGVVTGNRKMFHSAVVTSSLQVGTGWLSLVSSLAPDMVSQSRVMKCGGRRYMRGVKLILVAKS